MTKATDKYYEIIKATANNTTKGIDDNTSITIALLVVADSLYDIANSIREGTK